MGTKRHVRAYGSMEPEQLEQAMNGTHPSSKYNRWKLADNERVTAVIKDQFKGWIVFSDEIVMGPTDGRTPS